MSLIQDALKRQQAEGGQTPAAPKPPIPGLAMKAKPPPPAAGPAPDAAAPSQPAVPPPLPQQTQPPAPPETTQEAPPPEAEPEVSPAERKALSTLAIVILVIDVLLMSGISLVYFAFTKMKRTATEKSLALLTPALTQMVSVATQAVPAATAAKPPAATTQQVAIVAATNVPAVSNASPTIAPPPSSKPVIEWPSLKLTAIAGKGLKGAARINGQVIMVGETVEGVTLVEINEQNVVLRFKGETDTLRIGATTR